MDTALATVVASIIREHEPVASPEGFVDCSCGWESNHPRLATDAEQRQFEDPNHPDPADRTGAPDPDHMTDEAHRAHVAALIEAAATDFYAD